MIIRANYYQQFDADCNLDVPAEGYGGWKSADIDISMEHTALVVMHAWDTGTPEMYPGWWRCVEYIPRALNIAKTIFPVLLSTARGYGFRIYHIASSDQNLDAYPGYKRTLDIAGGPGNAQEWIQTDPGLEKLREFRSANVFVGKHNEEDVSRGFLNMDFLPQAKPLDSESIAKDSDQLFTLCKTDKINHLIYTGFAINWCLLLSPGGMADMSKRGIMCSTIKQAVTAVENKETARNELCKDIALWRVALTFGFVFDLDDFVSALQGAHSNV